MSVRDMTFVALFAAVVAILGLIPPIPVPLIPAPITAQTLGVMLAGSLLGARLGGLSLLVFVIIVLLGAPLLSGGRGGFSILTQPTGGYFLSWPIAAFLIGYMVQRLGKQIQLWKLLLINFVGGIVVIYAIGIPYLSFITEIPVWTVAKGNLAFIPGDLVKIVIAAIIASRVLKVYPISDPSRN